MEWSEEEKMELHHSAEAAFIGVLEWDPAVREDCNDRCVTIELRRVAERIASRAVELAAARDGTMPAERMMAFLSPPFTETGIGYVAQRISALGARNATLEAEVNTLSQRLVESTQKAQENREKQEAEIERLDARFLEERQRAERLQGERDAAIRRAEHGEARVRQLAIAGQEPGVEVDKRVGDPDSMFIVSTSHLGVRVSEVGAVVAGSSDTSERSPYERWPHPERYPCSPTCTHDDAAAPGHPERVKERSEAVSAAPQATLDAEHASEHPEWPARADDDTCAVETEAYAEGAEAMRAACWHDIQACLRVNGVTSLDVLWDAIKAAIEGAVP